MESLETGKLYIKDLFGKSRFYRIPEYQRPYVWGTDQINDLLNDISEAMDSNSEKEYFLGCMIWNTMEEKTGGYRYQSQDILDGQQRFITLFLLHSVLRDLSADAQLKTKVQQRLRQVEDRFDNIPALNRLTFAIRQDKSFLDEWVLTEGKTIETNELKFIAKDEGRTTSERRMAEALVDIGAWWAQRFDEIPEGERQEYVNDFFAYLSNKVLALFLATPDNLDDAYNLFTVLNSRGLQLQAADILRAQNLRHIDNDANRREFARNWDTYADMVRLPLHSFDELLKYAALSKIRFTSDKTKSLNHAFEYLFERSVVERGEGFFRMVGEYAGHFDAISSAKLNISEADKTTFENIYFIHSWTIGSLFVMPLLHYRLTFGDHGILEFLVKLDNLVSMGWLLGKRTLQQRMFLMIRRMDDIKTEQAAPQERVSRFLNDDVLKYEYRYQNSKTDMYVEEFKELLDTENWGAFGGARLNKTRYLLLKLDLLHGGTQTRLSFNRAVSSVEHVMPQRPKGLTNPKDKERHSEWVHRLGNLVLLDSHKNSSLSNSEFKMKKDRYKNAFEARPYTNSLFLKYDGWDFDTLHSQHEYAVEVLVNYYRNGSLQDLRRARTQQNMLI